MVKQARINYLRGMLHWLSIRWVYHTLVWATVIAVFVGLEWENDSTAPLLTSIGESLQVFIVPVPLIYLHLWGKDRWLAAQAYYKYAAWVAFVMLLGLLAYWLDTSDGNSFWQDLVNVVFFIVTSTGLQYFKRGLVEQYQQQEIVARTVSTELRALRNQLNPHFLFNTLNNIHGVNLRDSEKGSEMLIELSSVMRYHLDYSQRVEISLEDEVELLHGYIKLEQLRLGGNCKLSVHLPENPPEITISPLLLLPLVENAFKHGTHPTRNCFVHVSLEASSERVLLTVFNSRINSREGGAGVGLTNVKRRLELIYPNQHSLRLNEEGGNYRAELTLSL